MNQIGKKLSSFLFCFAALALFGACSGAGGNVAFESGGATSLASSAVPSSTVNQIIATCADVSAKDLLSVDDEIVDFAASTKACPFGQGDNLSKMNSLIRARTEESLALKNLPANAVICDVQMKVAQQHFKYDDVFLLTLNGHVLATNDKTALLRKSAPAFSATLDGKSVSVYDYSWSNILNLGFPIGADDYCVGAAQGLSTCQFPISQHDGPISLNFDHRLLIGMTANVATNRFGLVVTGDNDSAIDCMHEDLSIAMHVSYYLAH